MGAPINARMGLNNPSIRTAPTQPATVPLKFAVRSNSRISPCGKALTCAAIVHRSRSAEVRRSNRHHCHAVAENHVGRLATSRRSPAARANEPTRYQGLMDGRRQTGASSAEGAGQIEVMGTHTLVSVIDDDESVREALTDLLPQLGFAAQAFSSAEGFLASAFVAQTSCLILDIAL